MGDERGEKRWLDAGAIKAIEALRRRYGDHLSDSDIVRILTVKAQDLDDLTRERAKRLTVG